MQILNAYGCFMYYCNNHFSEPGIKEFYKKGCNEILNSPEERFANCSTVQDVLAELSCGLDYKS